MRKIHKITNMALIFMLRLFFAQITMKFKKLFNLKIISVLISISFIFTITLYSYPNSEDPLRIPVGGKDTYRRITEVMGDDREHTDRIDVNLHTAHQDRRVYHLHEKRPDVIEIVHQFLKENGLEEAIPLFEELQEHAAVEIEVENWDKGGLWLVEPIAREELPLEHASDKGGIHIINFPGADLERAYAHGIAAYIGLPRWITEPFEEAFAKWRETGKPTLSEDLKRNFLEMLQERKENPFLLTQLSKKERQGIYQRDYALAGKSTVKIKNFAKTHLAGTIVIAMVEGQDYEISVIGVKRYKEDLTSEVVDDLQRCIEIVDMVNQVDGRLAEAALEEKWSWWPVEPISQKSPKETRLAKKSKTKDNPGKKLASGGTLHLHDIVKPGMHMIDFGCGPFPKWGATLVEKTGIKYTGLEWGPKAVDCAKRWIDSQWSHCSDKMQIIKHDYLKPLPQDIEKADVVVLNTPKTEPSFMEWLSSGAVTETMFNGLKDNGLALIYTENDTYDKDGKKQVGDGQAVIAFEKALKQIFGEANVVKLDGPPNGYNSTFLDIVYEKGKRTFFIAYKLSESSDSSRPDEKLASGQTVKGLDKDRFEVLYYPGAGRDVETMVEILENFPNINEVIFLATSYIFRADIRRIRNYLNSHKDFEILKRPARYAIPWGGKVESFKIRYKKNREITLWLHSGSVLGGWGFNIPAREIPRDIKEKAMLHIQKCIGEGDTVSVKLHFCMDLITGVREKEALLIQAFLPLQVLDLELIGFKKIDAASIGLKEGKLKMLEHMNAVTVKDGWGIYKKIKEYSTEELKPILEIDRGLCYLRVMSQPHYDKAYGEDDEVSYIPVDILKTIERNYDKTYLSLEQALEICKNNIIVNMGFVPDEIRNEAKAKLEKIVSEATVNIDSLEKVKSGILSQDFKKLTNAQIEQAEKDSFFKTDEDGVRIISGFDEAERGITDLLGSKEIRTGN